jgi:hypothetical protein
VVSTFCTFLSSRDEVASVVYSPRDGVPGAWGREKRGGNRKKKKSRRGAIVEERDEGFSPKKDGEEVEIMDVICVLLIN